MKLIGVFALGAICGLAINAIVELPTSRQEIADFAVELTVDRVANGVRMTCTQGCAWETLSFACGPSATDCKGSFDQFGTPAY